MNPLGATITPRPRPEVERAGQMQGHAVSVQIPQERENRQPLSSFGQGASVTLTPGQNATFRNPAQALSRQGPGLSQTLTPASSSHAQPVIIPQPVASAPLLPVYTPPVHSTVHDVHRPTVTVTPSVAKVPKYPGAPSMQRTGGVANRVFSTRNDEIPPYSHSRRYSVGPSGPLETAIKVCVFATFIFFFFLLVAI